MEEKHCLFGIICVLFLFLFYIIFNSKECFTASNSYRSLSSWTNNSPAIMNLPLSEFYINSSHNSYLSGYQILGDPSYKNVEYALKAGARNIELDIHAYKSTLLKKASNAIFFIPNIVTSLGNALQGKRPNDRYPVVTHGNGSINDVKYSELSIMLQTIKDNAFKLTSDPLIIYLEIFDSNDEYYMQLLAAELKQYLGDYLYEYTFDKLIPNKELFNKKYVFKVPIRDLQNKIILIINYFNMENKDNRNKYLYPLIHGCTNEPDTGWCRDQSYPIVNGVDEREPVRWCKDKEFLRVFPYNTLKSTNFNPEPYWASGYNMTSLNFSNEDMYLERNKMFFYFCGYIPKKAIIGPSGEMTLPSGIFRNVNLYNNSISGSGLIMPNTIYKTGTWYSLNREYRLTFQSDGNFVLYDRNNKAKWASGTSKNTDVYLMMQDDGNLVIYKENGKAIWSSGTSGKPGAYGKIGSDGAFTMSNNKGDRIKTIN